MSEENEQVSEAPETVEVHEAPEVQADEKPNRDSLIKEHGWSAEEADKAVGYDLASKDEKPAPVEKKPEPTPEQVEEKRREDRRRGQEQYADIRKGLTKEQEDAFFKIFPPGTPLNGAYLYGKQERSKRQQIERELQQIRSEYEAIRKQGEVRQTRPEVDENGIEIDPENKPLTVREWKELQRREAEAQQKQQEEVRSRSERLTQAIEEQEEIARSMYPDFDDSMKLASDLAQNLKTLIADPAEQAFARKLMEDFKDAATNADKRGGDQLTAADLAVRVARLHPRYGKPQTNGANAEASSDSQDGIQPEIDPKKGNGGQKLTPDQLEKLKANTQRRPSSASIPGSGSHRTVSPDDVTLDDLNRMSSDERMAFKDKYRNRFEKLIA